MTPEYQSSKAGAKAIFALDNLWDGIGAVMMQHPGIVYLFGKMTMYPSYDRSCRDLIVHFLWKHFGDRDELVRPYNLEMPLIDGRLLDLILKDDDFQKSQECRAGTRYEHSSSYQYLYEQFSYDENVRNCGQ